MERDNHGGNVGDSQSRSNAIPMRSRASTREVKKFERVADSSQTGCYALDDNVDVDVSSSSDSCRICRDSTAGCDVISPCHCSGTLGRVHVRCLEEWLSASNKNECEICKYEYHLQRTPKTFRQWLKNPRSRTERRYIIGDCACFIILTPLVIAATSLCAQGSFYYFSFGQSWIAAGLMVLCSFLWFVYCFWVTITFRFHRKTWRQWRARNQTVRLLQHNRRGLDEAPRARLLSGSIGMGMVPGARNDQRRGTLCTNGSVGIELCPHDGMRISSGSVGTRNSCRSVSGSFGMDPGMLQSVIVSRNTGMDYGMQRSVVVSGNAGMDSSKFILPLSEANENSGIEFVLMRRFTRRNDDVEAGVSGIQDLDTRRNIERLEWTENSVFDEGQSDTVSSPQVTEIMTESAGIDETGSSTEEYIQETFV